MNTKFLKSATLVALFTTGTLQARDTPITFEQLPSGAQNFIKTNFNGATVAFAEKDVDYTSTDYEVVLNNGVKIDFDQNGEWKEVDGKHTAIPTSFIDKKITNHVQKNFAGANIIAIDKGYRKYEVELSNGLELIFSPSFDFLGIDD